jgi:hypothetical protein
MSQFGQFRLSLLHAPLDLRDLGSPFSQALLLHRRLLAQHGEALLMALDAGAELVQARLGLSRIALRFCDPLLECGEIARGAALRGEHAFHRVHPLLRSSQGIRPGVGPAVLVNGENPTQNGQE